LATHTPVVHKKDPETNQEEAHHQGVSELLVHKENTKKDTEDGSEESESR
jgi:hypothetical protein